MRSGSAQVACFIYDFVHSGSYTGIQTLSMAGIRIGCILAAPWRPLEEAKTNPPEAWSSADREELSSCGPLYSIEHSDTRVSSIIHAHNCVMGVVLGARILPSSTISAFPLGVVNVHPGLAPWNRGLDSYKWAVVKGYGQGVTCHLIGNRIDYGPLLIRRALASLEDMTLGDIKQRLRAMSMDFLPEAVQRGLSGATRLMEAAHPYHSRMTDELAGQVLQEYARYKETYPAIIERWIQYDY